VESLSCVGRRANGTWHASRRQYVANLPRRSGVDDLEIAMLNRANFLDAMTVREVCFAEPGHKITATDVPASMVTNT